MWMRSFSGTLLLISLAACSGSEQADQDSLPEGSVAEPETRSAVALSSEDLIRVCKAGQHHSVGTPLDVMEATVSGEATVRLSYTRDDGKSFRYDCRITGNVIQTRMIDEAGPGSGPGAWSGRGSTLTFEHDAQGVTLYTVFFDGTTDSERVEI